MDMWGPLQYQVKYRITQVSLPAARLGINGNDDDNKNTLFSSNINFKYTLKTDTHYENATTKKNDRMRQTSHGNGPVSKLMCPVTI